ncbi:unnamed protein product [Citrullus colocynthis]|uniref:Uncharacterized protein n=1 Tax=Citrullus colocynthis TaxID=252529 RepID=A0ABP0Y4V8_9ROSI
MAKRRSPTRRGRRGRRSSQSSSYCNEFEVEDERDEWVVDGFSLGRGLNGFEEVTESRTVVSLGRGSDRTKEMSKRMGLARAVSLGYRFEGTKEVSERVGLTRVMLLGRGSGGTEEVSERLGVGASARRRVGMAIYENRLQLSDDMDPLNMLKE